MFINRILFYFIQKLNKYCLSAYLIIIFKVVIKLYIIIYIYNFIFLFFITILYQILFLSYYLIIKSFDILLPFFKVLIIINNSFHHKINIKIILLNYIIFYFNDINDLISFFIIFILLNRKIILQKS